VTVPLGICTAVIELFAKASVTIEFVAIKVAVIALGAILAVVIPCPAILAVVTCAIPIWIVSILPDTSSEESTELAAIAAASTELSPTAVTAEPCN
jgi:hypothetical protein